MTMRRALITFFGCLALAGCECGEPMTTPDGGGMDAEVRPDGAPGPDAEAEPDGGSCTVASGACTADGDCCIGLRCEEGTCTAGGCGMDGDACTLGSDCCSLHCEGGVCATGGSCESIGGSCTDDGDCCSFNCQDGTCADNPLTSCDPIGEACTDRGQCCSDRCAGPDGAPCAGGGDCRCDAAAVCRASGELCTNDAQCCIGICDRPDGATVGVCAASGACAVAGQPCGTEGFNGSCCSTACLDAMGTGTPTCQPLGGCRVQDETCRTDADCCSGACNPNGTGADGRPILRCAKVTSCAPAGEVCGFSGATSNCCPDGGGRTGCEPASTGVHRCIGGDGSCTLPGATCEDTADCCTETFPDIECREGRTGALVCCLPDGAECAFGDICCGGVCAPGSDGVLRCGASCVADAMPCTADADCCGCACVSDGSGGRVCTSDPAQCGACTGADLGEFCTADEDCCNHESGAVICSPGLEFRTCILAP